MNKKLLTLAVAGVLAGGFGVAQADVTVYGLAHVSIDKIHGTQVTDDVVVTSNASRLGVKASEDLGNGLKALAQYETTVSMDGENTLFGGVIRNTYVGLNGGFGTVLAGTYDTPMKIIGRAVELFPEYIGDARNITGVGGGGLGFDQRPPNVVAYTTPNMGGFSMMALYSADTGTTTNTDVNANRLYGLNGVYSSGPLYVGLAYEIHNYVPIDVTSENHEGLRLTASGTFGNFRVVGLYQQLKNLNGTSGRDRNDYGLGASFTMGSHVIKAQYYVADNLDNATAGQEFGASMYAVGYDFKFSKSTTAYVAYAKTSNDDGSTTANSGNFTVNAGSHGDALTPTGGLDPTAISVGMIVKF